MSARVKRAKPRLLLEMFKRLAAMAKPNPKYMPLLRSSAAIRMSIAINISLLQSCFLTNAEHEHETPNVERPHHAHCRMSLILPAVCTIVSPSRSAVKVSLSREIPLQTTGTESACIAAAKYPNNRFLNSNRPNDAHSLECFAPRGRLDPTTG